MTPPTPLLPRLLPSFSAPLLALLIFSLGCVSLVRAAEERASHRFDIPAGPALDTLKLFTAQSGEQLLYSSDAVAGVQTKAVNGTMPAVEALNRMFAGTELSVTEDRNGGGLTVRREPADKKKDRQSTPTGDKEANQPAGAKVLLPTFTVVGEKDNSFEGRQSLSLTRTGIDLADIPQSVSVINRSFIDAISPLSLNEMVQYVAGGQVGNLPGMTFIQRFMLRGFTSQGDFVDGFWLGSGGPSTMEFIDHIEVIKGPSAIMSTTATGAVGGAVNKVSVSPTTTQQNTLTLSLGRYSSGAVTLDVGGALTKDNKLLWRLVALRTNQQRGFYDYSYLRQTDVMPMLLYHFSPSTEAWVKFQYLEEYGSSYNGLVLDGRTNQPVVVPATTSFGEDFPNNFRRSIVRRLWAQFTTRPNDHLAIRFAASDIYHDQVGTESTLAAVGSTTPVELPDGTFTYTPFVQYAIPPSYVSGQLLARSTSTQETINPDRVLQNDYAFNFETGPVSHNLLLGASLSDFPAITNSWGSGAGAVASSSSIDPFAPRTAGTVVVNYGTPPVTSRDTAQTYAKLFALETAGFFDNRLQLSYGVSRHRFDTSATTYTFDQLTNKAGTPASVPEAALYKNLVQYGIVIKPLKGVSLFYGKNSNFAANPIQNGSFLPPQLGTQSEAGIKLDLARRFKVAVSYFEINQFNNTVPAFPKTIPQTVVLIPGQSSRGFDGDFELNLNRNIDIVGSFALFRTRVQAALPYNLTPQPYDGKLYQTLPVNNASEKNFSVLARYSFRDGLLKGLSLGVSNVNLSKRAITDNSNQILYGYLPGYSLFNLIASYETKRFKYQVNIDNVLNKDYWFSSRNQLLIVPGTPINPRITVSYRF